MELVLWLAAGLVGGILAVLAVLRSFPTEPTQWIGALVVGLLGGWVGGWLTDLAGLEQTNWIGSLVIAFVGASIILLVIRKLTPSKGKGKG